MCRKAFGGFADNLIDNFAILGLVEKSISKPRTVAEQWCRDCSKDATAACIKEHQVCELSKARRQELEPRLGALQADGEAVRGLLEALDQGVQDLQEFRGVLERALGALKEAGRTLQDALPGDEGTWERAKQTADQARTAQDAAKLLPALGDPASLCSLTQQLGPVLWRGSVRPHEDALVRVLLLKMVFNGGLQQEGGPEGDPAAAVFVQDATRRGPESNNEQTVLGEEEAARRMKPGCRVVRGRDWDPKSTRDGTPPQPGVVQSGDFKSGYWTVAWGQGHYFSMGAGGKYELKLLPTLPKRPPVGGVQYSGSLFYDAGTVCSTSDVGAMTRWLQNPPQQIRVVVGLKCNLSPAWSKKVLQKVAPTVVVLQLDNPDIEHVRLTTGMPQLKALYLSQVDAKMLELALSLVQLTHLEVHCLKTSPLAGLRAPATHTLKWLRIGVYPLSATLAVLRAHALSLEELELVASATSAAHPYGCPDLPAELRRCGLVKLKKMVLLREKPGYFCAHIKAICDQQKLKVMDMFLSISDIVVNVLCSVCDKFE